MHYDRFHGAFHNKDLLLVVLKKKKTLLEGSSCNTLALTLYAWLKRTFQKQHFSFSQTSTRVSIKQLDYELEISIAAPSSTITHRNRELII